MMILDAYKPYYLYNWYKTHLDEKTINEHGMSPYFKFDKDGKIQFKHKNKSGRGIDKCIWIHD